MSRAVDKSPTTAYLGEDMDVSDKTFLVKRRGGGAIAIPRQNLLASELKTEAELRSAQAWQASLAF